TVDREQLAFLGHYFVRDVWRGLHEVQVAVALQALLDDLAVEHPQEATTKTEAESLTRLRQVREARIIQPKLGQCLPKKLKVPVVDRIQAAKHHRLGLLVARQCRFRGFPGIGDRVAYMYIAQVLDLGHEIPYLARSQYFARRGGGPELSQLGDLIFGFPSH